MTSLRSEGDDEMRAQVNTEPFDPLLSDTAGLIRGTQFSGIGAEGTAQLIIDSLRRRGAWLPGSEVSDVMVDSAVAAYERCLKTHNLSGPEAEWSSMRAGLTAALNAIPRSKT